MHTSVNNYMGKILIISDVHINDYVHRNPSYRYRLYQTRIVAQNIIEVAKQEGVDTIFIAGDLIHKSVMRPYIMAEVKGFLDTLMGYFKTGRIIYGNHDLDSKLPNQKTEDCILSLILPANLKYADQTVETFGNSTIAFSNWRQSRIDLSWLQAPVDYLITHATISYSPGDFFTSTELDESKFGMCFSGDIHKPAQKGKFVSIGIPQRCGMGDSEHCTGVVLDPVGKQWKYVNLNPGDNLMKMAYVKDQSLEGYHAPSNTWYIYQPDKTIVPGVSAKTTQLWAEVDSLIGSVISQEGLDVLHQEVLRRIPTDAEDLDLGFTLTALRCKNWRSIDYLDMSIAPGDRIILHGHNGAGKSSILSALKYALLEKAKGLGSFVCNKSGDKSCWAEVDFLYQGHQYTLRRGTSNSNKNWGLVVDGIQQAYPNITSFNKDVAKRFPFLEILGYFYFDDQHSRFLGDMKDEEKPLLIAKLLKLGKIDIYHDTAESILAEIRKANEAWSFRKIDIQRNLERLESQKLSLRVPGKSLEKLMSERQEGYDLQRKANAFLNYQMKVSERSGRIEALNTNIKSTQSQLEDLGPLARILSELDDTQRELVDQRAIEGSIQNLSVQLKDLQRQLEEVNAEGSKLYSEYTNLKPDVCPTCGQPVNSEVLQKYKANLEERLIGLQGKQSTLHKLIKNCKFNQSDLDRTRKTIKELEALQAELIRKQGLVVNLQSRLQTDTAELKGLMESTGITEIPEKVMLPENALQIMSGIEADIASWNKIQEADTEISRLSAELTMVEAELGKSGSAVSELERYLGLTCPTGTIYTEVLTKVATEFSDNQVHYEATKFTFRKIDHLDLECYYITPDGRKILYESASGGQKTIMDLHIMSKLVEGLGLVVFDEFLKSLDPGNHDEMLQIIKDMKIGAIMLVSHQDGISGFQNKTMELALDPNTGMTQIQFL